MMNKFLIFFLLLLIRADAQTDQNTFQSELMNKMPISVTIGGNFIANGTFPAGINERVDQFVTRIFTLNKEKLLQSAGTDQFLVKNIMNQLAQYSFRNVSLIRSGNKTHLDLVKFRMTGDFTHNPYLKNDDVILFESTNLATNFISITGAVNNPGRYPYVEGDRLQDAILIAGGINPVYKNENEIIINRLSDDGKSESIIPVDISSNPVLMIGDRVVVRADETSKKSLSATILGEVNMPGLIPITVHNTTLKEVINRAGGIKETASLKNARLFTGSSVRYLFEKEYGVSVSEYPDQVETELAANYMRFEYLLMNRMSNVTIEDSSYFLMENQLRVMSEGTSVDFTHLNEEGSEASKYIVKDGDIIIIPQKTTTVYVFGQVPRPGHLNYLPGKDYLYYINTAGGFGEYAVDDEVMIIKGSSRNWVRADKEVQLEEGDFVYIPRRIVKSFYQYAVQAATYLGIVASLATVILLIVQLTKTQ